MGSPILSRTYSVPTGRVIKFILDSYSKPGTCLMVCGTCKALGLTTMYLSKRKLGSFSPTDITVEL